MAQNNETNDPEYSIISNVVESGYLLGIPYRNWLEGIISFLLILIFVLLIPFTNVVRAVIVIIYGLGAFIFNLRGIMNRSLSQMFIAELNFRRNRRILHLRGPEFKKSKQDFSKYLGSDESNGKILLLKIRDRVNSYADSVIEKSEVEND